MKYLLIVSVILIIGVVIFNNYNIAEPYENIENQYLGSQEKYYDSRLSGPILANQNEADKFYVYDASKPAGQQLVMKDTDVTLQTNNVDVNVKRCKQITNCDQLDGTSCGYCFLNETFSYGNKDGPYTDVCPGGWVTTKEGCISHREKVICSKVTNCHEMIGEASICGWCAASNKAFVSKNVDGKLEPKYSTDTCADEGYGLVGQSNCTKFGQEHPCIGPNESTGPHSMTCLSALWKKSGCSIKGTNAPTQPGKNNSWWNERSWEAVLADMKAWYSDATGTNMELVQSHQEGCLGTKPNPCDPKYEGNLACYQQIFTQNGCSNKASGYPIDTVPGMSTQEYISKVKQLVEQSRNTSLPYETRNEAYNYCHGSDLPKASSSCNTLGATESSEKCNWSMSLQPSSYGSVITKTYSGPCDATFQIKCADDSLINGDCQQRYGIQNGIVTTNKGDFIGTTSCCNQSWSWDSAPKKVTN